MRKLLREPLAHFALVGAALFGISLLLRRPAAEGHAGRIVVTSGHIEQMTVGFTRTWRRPPSVEELEDLLEDHIREEVLAREAAALGLDRDDVIIKRRLRQKMDVVLEDVAQLETPTEQTLRDFLEKRPDLFQRDGRAAFRQVYLSRERRGDSMDVDASALLEQLRKGALPESLGDPSVLPAELPLTPASELDRLFGPPFGRQLLAVKPGAWTGPVDSAYGRHLVLVTEIVPGRRPAFDEVKDEVRREWALARRRETTEAAYRRLRERYTVVVDRPARPKP